MRKPRSRLIFLNLRLPRLELKRLKMKLSLNKKKLKRPLLSGKDRLPLPRKSQLKT